jgi:hypothetical protein
MLCLPTVYLARSVGCVYGVAITFPIGQTTFSVRLPDALGGISDIGEYAPFLCCVRCYSGMRLGAAQVLTPGRLQVIDEMGHSMPATRRLPPDVQFRARSSATTACDIRSRLRRPSLLRPCAPPTSPTLPGFRARNNSETHRRRKHHHLEACGV